jgi:hypothetical protein
MTFGNRKHPHSKHIASDNVYLEIELHWLKYEYTYTSSKEDNSLGKGPMPDISTNLYPDDLEKCYDGLESEEGRFAHGWGTLLMTCYLLYSLPSMHNLLMSC